MCKNKVLKNRDLFSLILVGCFTFLANCNTERTRNNMLKDIPGVYCLSNNTRKEILDYLQCDSLKLILKKDLTYEFFPKLEKLVEYEGTWTLSRDAEISYWVFTLKNGRKQYNRFLSINLGMRDNVLDSLIRFTWDCEGSKVVSSSSTLSIP
jgi:hypothetical protein